MAKVDKPKTREEKAAKVEKVMHEFKERSLTIGNSDKKVKSRKQAIAIALSEAGQTKTGKKAGKKKAN